MTLKSRLLLATLVLGLATTLVMAWVIRDAWRSAERDKFEREFEVGAEELSSQLDAQAQELLKRLAPLCEHDPLIDSALLGHKTDSLASRLLPLKLRLPEQASALGLDELALVTDTGEVVAGELGGHTGSVSPNQVKARVMRGIERPGLRPERPLAFEAACKAREEGRWVALVGAMHVDRILEEAGRRYGLDLQLSHQDAPAVEKDPQRFQLSHQLPGAPHHLVTASRPRWALDAALASLNQEIVWAALSTLGVALVIALLIARGIARPVSAFAEKTRDAVKGSVAHIPETGGAELQQAARAFNQTLDDLAALRKRLQATERIAARREMARQVAHEIKNPLSPIRTSVETLRKLHERRHPEFDEFFDQATRTVLQEVSRISALVENFSRYARLPSPTPKKTNLSGLVEELAAIHRELGAEVTTEITPGLDVLLDRDQIAQVVTNLVKNALEATKEQPEPHVCVRLWQNQDLVLLEVEDNGPGIAPDLAERLFEPHVTTKAGGSGLGLPISHRIAVEHGGDLTYSSPSGRGACFRLTLPVRGPPQVGSDPSLPKESSGDVS